MGVGVGVIFLNSEKIMVTFSDTFAEALYRVARYRCIWKTSVLEKCSA